MKKIILFIGVVIIVLILCIYIVMSQLGEDEPPPRDADLRLEVSAISERENAYTYLMQAVEKSSQDKEQISALSRNLDGKDWDLKLVANLIDKNEESFNLLDEALKCSAFQTPLATEYELGKRIQYSSCRDLALLMLIKAIYLCKQGKEQEAFDEAVKLLKLGHLIEWAPDCIVVYFIGSAIKGFGLKAIRQMAKETNLPEEKMMEYSVAISKFRANEEGLIKSAKWEYMMVCKMVDNDMIVHFSMEEADSSDKTTVSKSKQKKVPGYFFKPNKTKRIIGERFRIIISNISYPFAKMKITEDPNSYRKPHKFWLFLTENSLGKIFSSITVSSYEGMLLQKCREDFEVSAIATLLALKAYKIRNGTLPDTLDQLVPEYLSMVPVDPFDGKPLRYSRDKRIIYAVGKDLIDSGGEVTSKEDLREPTIMIEL